MPVEQHQAAQWQDRWRNPVWQDSSAKRIDGIKQKERRPHAKEKQEQWVASMFPPKGKGCPNGGEAKDRIQQTSLDDQELTEERQAPAPWPWLLEPAAVRQMGNRDPVVPRVPDQHGQRTQHDYENCRVRTGPAQLNPCGLPQNKEYGPTEQLKQRGVLAQKAKANP